MQLSFLKKAIMLLVVCVIFVQCHQKTNEVQPIEPPTSINECNLPKTIEYKDYVGIFSQHYKNNSYFKDVVFIHENTNFGFPTGEYHLPTPFDNDKMIQVCNYKNIFANNSPDYSKKYKITIKVAPRGDISIQPFPLPALIGEITKIEEMVN